jgi:hypothetical protein
MIKLTNLLREIISEGGNVFKNSDLDTENISLENIKPTLVKFASDLGALFPSKKSTFIPLTDKSNWLVSTGNKPTSGDVDIAYSSEHFFKNGQPDVSGWGLDPNEYTALFEKNKKSARSATEEAIQIKSLIQLIVKKINASGTELYASDKAANGGTIHFSYPQYSASGEKLPERTQLDLDSGDMDWLKFRYNSVLPEDDPNIKGLHRGQLMLAMFASTGYTFKNGKGFIRKATGETIASTPKDTMDVFNDEYKPKQPLTLDTINSYPRLVEYIKTNLRPEDRDATLNMFKEALRRADAYIPNNI